MSEVYQSSTGGTGNSELPGPQNPKGSPGRRVKAIWVAGGILVLLALGAGGFYAWRSTAAQSSKAPAQSPVPAVPQEIVLTAQLHAQTSVEVAAPMVGRIDSVNVEVGDEVYEGQLLAVVKSDSLESQRQAAAEELEKGQEKVNALEAAISAARLEASRASADYIRVRSEHERAFKNYQREKLLLEKGATARRQFEKAEKEFQALDEEIVTLEAVAKQSEDRVSAVTRELDVARKLLQAQSDDVEGARERLAAGEVLAPVNGIVTGTRARAAELVDLSMKNLFVIATDLSKMEAIADLPRDAAKNIRAGQEAYIAVAESSSDLLPGTVRNVEDGTVTVEFSSPNPAVRPGLTAQIRIRLR